MNPISSTTYTPWIDPETSDSDKGGSSLSRSDSDNSLQAPLIPQEKTASPAVQSSHPLCDDKDNLTQFGKNIRLHTLLLRGLGHTKAQASLISLATVLPSIVQAKRMEKGAYMEAIAQKISTDEFKHPEAMTGSVSRGKNGEFKSSNNAIQAILRYVQHKYPQESADLDLSRAAKLSLPLETSVLLKAKEFSRGCEVRNLDLKDGSSQDVSIDLMTYSTRQAIKKGTHGFGEEARLQPGHLDSEDASNDSESFPLHLAHAGEIHPFAFLQDVRYQVASDHPEMKELVEKCLNDHDPVTLDLRGRLGAQALQSVISQKSFSKELGWAMAASMVGSGGLAYALDVIAWGAVTHSLSSRLGEDHPATKFADVVLSSLTPLFAETMDSLVIKRLMGAFKHEPLLPESFGELVDDLKDSAISGSIAAIGSVPNNIASLSQKWAIMPASMVANQLAASTSAAMVPRELARSHEEMSAGVIQKMNEGFFPAPKWQAKTHNQNETHKALSHQIKKETSGALGVAPGDGLAINSMGIGSVISLGAGFLPFDIMGRAHLIPSMVQKVTSIMVNTPTEVLSMGTGILTANHLGGLSKWMTTDAQKNRNMVELIANKAVERLHNGSDTRAEITEEELQKIEHPSLALTFPLGESIVNTMNGIADLLSSSWAALRGKPSESLSEQIDIGSLVSDSPHSSHADNV
ncbi:hypothetical protein BIY29_04245 [Brenneria alni]|uniref:Type III effector n=1 Tax=Brenneria alni TaxID=71656 RepID=A0A421DRL8_9GAMM|nr:hypothetical protein [Brenneria alni]RLM26832.1 hypothetical protein BIY29_04245 [Brenneria alni]